MRQRHVLLLALACFILAAILGGTIGLEQGVARSVQSEPQPTLPSLQGIPGEKSKSGSPVDLVTTSGKQRVVLQFGKSWSEWLDVEETIELETVDEVRTQDEDGRPLAKPEPYQELVNQFATSDPEDEEVRATLFFSQRQEDGTWSKWEESWGAWMLREDYPELERDELFYLEWSIPLDSFPECQIKIDYEIFDCWGALRFHSERFYDNSSGR